MHRDENLLFGVFAVQLRKVTPPQITEAAGAWATDPTKNLPSRLVDAGSLAENDRDLIQRFVDEAVEAHGGDATTTLAAFGGGDAVSESFSNSIVISEAGEVTKARAGVSMMGSGDSDSMPGVDEFPGRYTRESEHARGGMGRILLVHDEHLGRDIALKELMPDAQGVSDTDDPSPVRLSAPFIARFLQEARITSQLEHPGVVPVYELGHRPDGTLYYTMKLVRGQSLEQAIRNTSSLRERLALLPHFVDLCQAIAYAHSRNVIHRDIKPANVMVGEFGETVVIDWGLAKARGKEDVYAEGLRESIRLMSLGDGVESVKTAYGNVMGTPAYMSPEQAKGQLEQIDQRSDVYSLGTVLYELLTGEVPFTGESLDEVLLSVIRDKPESVRVSAPDAPSELIAICERAMDKDPDKRYQSAKALADEIQRFLTGGVIQAYRYGLGEIATRFVRRHRTLVATTAVAVLVLAAFTAYYIINLNRTNRELLMARDTADEALESETAARALAEEKRAEAEAAKEAETAARALAEEKRAEAEAAEALAERNAYVGAIRLAQAERERGNTAAAFAALEGTKKEWRNWEWGHLYGALDTSRLTLHGHGDTVNTASFSPDGLRIVTGSNDNIAKVWDAITGEEVMTLHGHAGIVTAASFSPDGLRIVTGSYDETAKVWDAATGEELMTLAGHSNRIRAASFSPAGRRIVTGSFDSTAKVWDAATGEEIITLAGHGQIVSAASFSPDGLRIVTGSWDNTAKVWDAATGEELMTLAGHREWVVAASYSPDGLRIVTGSWDKTAKVWDATTGEEVMTLTGHGDGFLAVSFSPDGLRIVTGSWDNTAKVWDAATGEEIMTLAGHGGTVDAASFSPDGRRIVTSSRDNTAKVWDAVTDQEIMTLSGHTEFVVAASFSPAGRRIVTGSRDNTAKVWDAVTGEEIITLAGHRKYVDAASFSPDGRRIVTGSWDNTAKVWDAATGEEIITLAGHGQVVSAASFSPDGLRIVTGSSDKTAKVWDAITGEELMTLTGHRDYVLATSFSPDGLHIVTGSRDKTAKVWDAATGKEIITLAGHGRLVDAASFSPDGRRIVTGSYDKTAKVWDAATGEEIMTLKGHLNDLNAASFSPDGRRIVTGSTDNTAKVWDATTGEELMTLFGHGAGVFAASFSPDGRRVVTGSWDGTAKVWDATPWARDSWTDPDLHDELVQLALQRVTASSRIIVPPVDMAREEAFEIASNVSRLLHSLISEAGTAVTAIPGEGFRIDRPEQFRSLEEFGFPFEEGDLILTHRNGREIFDLEKVSSDVDDFLAGALEAPAEITLVVLNFYEHRRLRIYFEGMTKQERTYSRKGLVGLASMAIAAVRANKRSAADAGDPVEDMYLFGGADLARLVGLESNDQIITFYERPIRGFDAFIQALETSRDALLKGEIDHVKLVVHRERTSQYIELTFKVENDD